MASQRSFVFFLRCGLLLQKMRTQPINSIACAPSHRVVHDAIHEFSHMQSKGSSQPLSDSAAGRLLVDRSPLDVHIINPLIFQMHIITPLIQHAYPQPTDFKPEVVDSLILRCILSMFLVAMVDCFVL